MTYREHLIEFTESNPPWRIVHAADCGSDDCPYARVAGSTRSLTSHPEPPGRYACSVNRDNRLTVGGRIPDRWDNLPTIEKPWTMGDLRDWVSARDHIPDDYRVTAHMPERPRGWAHTGGGLYTNTLHGLQVDDPEDFE